MTAVRSSSTFRIGLFAAHLCRHRSNASTTKPLTCSLEQQVSPSLRAAATSD